MIREERDEASRRVETLEASLAETEKASCASEEAAQAEMKKLESCVAEAQAARVEAEARITEVTREAEDAAAEAAELEQVCLVCFLVSAFCTDGCWRA